MARPHCPTTPVLCAAAAALVLLPNPAHAAATRILIAPTGVVAGDYFGTSVANAGDMNGDGFDDVIVGARRNDRGGAQAGAAFVFHGGPSADSTADLVLVGEAAADNFGVSVSGAGDVNGDGYDDVIVGANGNDANGPLAGRAYLYLGGPAADSLADLTFTGQAAGDGLGFSVGGAGDVNGDGFADFLVGVPADQVGGTGAGRVYVYYGGASVDTTADLVLVTEASDDEFGISVGTAGDLNGDGFDDIIVGAPRNDAAGTDAGRAYVYLGGPAADSTADVVLTGSSSFDEFGCSVGTAGDINGDGFDDVVVGAPKNNAGGTVAGRAYVYLGGEQPDTVADLTLTGESSLDNFGFSVGTAGDVDGDGFSDVVVGAWLSDGFATDAGRAYVFFGGQTADSTADWILDGQGSGDHFGVSVRAAGDVNGDGLADLIVGASLNDAGGPDAGRAYVISSFPLRVLAPNGGEAWVVGESATVRWEGPDLADLALSTDGGATFTTLRSGVGGKALNSLTLLAPGPATSHALIRLSDAGQVPNAFDDSDAVFRIVESTTPPRVACRTDRTFTGSAPVEFLGSSSDGGGDVNGDGYEDVIVGAPGHAGSTGRAYVFHGGPVGDSVRDLVLTGEAGNDAFGTSVGMAGDVNGDGFDDVIVGANQFLSGPLPGRAYVYYGGPAADSTADLVMSGEANGDLFGFAVGGAGDVNGDGYHDVIVGAWANDAGGGAAGRAYVYLGGPAPDAAADLTYTGDGPGDVFGIAVGAAGDVNGDGFDDVIIGAESAPAGGYGAGRAYVFHGGSTPDAAADLVLTGEAASDDFGGAVAGAGDVNGDGFDDLLVGADASDAGGSNSGRAYLFLGGPGGDAVPDLVLTGALSGDRLGTAVAAAGDVNGDGFDDIAVGLPGNDAGGTDAGRIHVLFGGPAPDADPDIVLTGEAAGDELGGALASGGDGNGDGFDDVVAGARLNGAGGVAAGRAYIFDCNRYFVTSPDGGETWNVGATETVSWMGSEPADVWLSVDGGGSFVALGSALGGGQTNALPILVPHLPTRFAQVRVTPSDGRLAGGDRSDSLFTIQASIALLSFQAGPPASGPGAVISWSTDPGPEDLAGYRLETGHAPGIGAVRWHTVLEGTRDTTYADPGAAPGTRYRLTAVNGLGDAYVLGETTLGTGAVLSARPLPYRGGELRVAFSTFGGWGGGAGPATVTLHDVSGRRVRTLARGDYPAGSHEVSWDGRDETGRRLASGIYFLRVETAGSARSLKLPVLR